MNNTCEFVIENGILLKYSGDGETVVIPEGVKEIRNNTFIARRNLSSVTIPESVTKIGYNAFHSCEGLVSVSIPESVIEIGGAAFALCKNLTSINIPKNITKIDDATFASCESLASITVPKGVLEIGDNAFDNCKNLISITIPESVGKIGDNVFIGSDKVVICTPRGSYAEQYAKANNIKLNPLESAEEHNKKTEKHNTNRSDNESNDILLAHIEKANAVFAKNDGPEVPYLDEYGKKCAKLLHNISIELIRNDFSQAREIIDNSFVINENLLIKYKDDIDSIMFAVNINNFAYSFLATTACESILHKNYVLFYAMIRLFVCKLDAAQRMFFYDAFALKSMLRALDEKANLHYPFSIESNVVEIYTELYLGAPVESVLFYQECIECYYPIGRFLKDKDDDACKQKSKYNTFEKLDLKWVENDFRAGVDTGDMREFIVEIDNYLNTVENKTKSGEMWNYLTEALLYDFLASPFQWNVELSKSIIMSMIGYSRCYTERNIMEYTTTMQKNIFLKLAMLKKIIMLMPVERPDSCNENLLQISLFLLNLYYIFPFDELLNFINDEIVSVVIASNLKECSIDNAILEAYCNIMEHIEKLRKNGRNITKHIEKLKDNVVKNNAQKDNQEGCYIATAVYGDYNDPNVMVLRRFRDNYLSKRNWGMKFIKLYYRHSPSLADKLKNHIVINSIIRKILDLLVKKLRKSQ